MRKKEDEEKEERRLEKEALKLPREPPINTVYILNQKGREKKESE